MGLKVILDAWSNGYAINTIIEILIFQLVEPNGAVRMKVKPPHK